MLTLKDKHAILAVVSLQSSNSNTSDIVCECHKNCSRQVFISHASSNAIFEGYLQATDELSTPVVERCTCVKEEREPLF